MNLNLTLLIHFCIIIIIYFIYFEYIATKSNDTNKQCEYYKSNRDNIKTYFSKKLGERLALLKNMSYDDWIKYNRNNKLMSFDNRDYYIFIWEAILDPDNKVRKDTYINKVNENTMYENVSFNDIQTTLNDEIKIIKYNIDPDLIKNMFFSKNPTSTTSYYWLDKNKDNRFENDDIVQKEAITKIFQKDGISGVIGISYTIDDIATFNSYKFYEIIDTPSLLLIISITFALSYCMGYIMRDSKNIGYYLPIIFLYVLNMYILHFVNDKTQQVNSDALTQKFQDMGNSTLSIAFLVSVNIFFINYMNTHNIESKIPSGKSDIYNCNIVLFCFSILILLSSLYKITSYSHGYDIRGIFLVQQLMYNLVIIINGIITLTYLAYVITEK